MAKIIGKPLENMPWEERAANSDDIVWRHSNNPIIGWNPIKNVARMFNSAVVPFEGKFAGVFRGDTKNGRPHLYVGFSEDALSWSIDETPIKWIDEEGKEAQPSYAYDPRVIEIEGIFYVVWCTDFYGASLGMGMTKDFKTFIRLENMCIPFNRNGVLFPRKVDGKYIMLTRPSDSGHTPFGDIFMSKSLDLKYWGEHRHVMSKGGSGWWQGTKIGGGPAPIETDEGWLLIYHGVSGTCNGFVYSMGAALLDKNEPSKVLYRTKNYILTPEKDYETVGFVPNVTFPCATLCDADTGRIAIYYGAADTYVAVAYTTVDLLLKEMKENCELVSGDNELGK